MNMISTSFGKPATFNDLINIIHNDEELTTTRCRDVTSAIRRFIGLLEIDLTSAAGVRAYRDRIDAFQPERQGLKARRWSTIRSDVGFALDRYGIVERHRPLPDELSPAWRALREAASAMDVRLFRSLSTFVYFCNRTGIAPQHVTDTAVASFLESRADSLRKAKRNRTHRLLCTYWNRAVAIVPSWPTACLDVPSFRNTYSLPITAFPQSFQDEFAYWKDVQAGKFPLAPKAPREPKSPATIRTRSEQVRRFASALVHSGLLPEHITSFAVLVEPKNFYSGLEYLLGRVQNRRTPTTEETALGMCYIAEHWVKLGEDDLTKLKELCDRVRCRQRGLTDKNLERLRQFNDPLNVLKIVSLPDTLEAAARKIANPKRRAQLMQTAVAIAILLVAPMRLRNLLGLDLDRHFQRSRRGRGAVVTLAIEPEEVKTGVPLEFEVPTEVVDLLDRYTDVHLPFLAQGKTKVLFPGKKAGPKHAVSLSDQIVKAIRRFTGLQMNVHLFRHLAAKLYLDRHPGDYATVSRLLGHKSIQTTMDFYVAFETAAAARHFDQTVLAPIRRKAAGVNWRARRG